MQCRIAFLVALSLLTSACGSANSKSSSELISGNWQMNLVPTRGKVTIISQSGFLLQNDNVIIGSMFLGYPSCTGVGSVAGSISGTNIEFTVDLAGLTVNLSGALGSDQASMSGAYDILVSGCQGSETNTPPETGSWTANLVKPLNGNFQGTFMSKSLQTLLPVTGQVTQGQNTGLSDTSLTGNLSISGYCFTGANISGLVSGTNVVIFLADPSGVQIGQVMGTSTVDGTSVTGTYEILPQGSTKACSDGDHGEVALTL